jgi:hypothetical protein
MVFGIDCSHYLKSWVDWVLRQVEALLAVTLAQAQAQVMEMELELELHVDLYHHKPDTGLGFRKPLLHTSYKVEYPPS